ncbi:SDR family NAD(P)-dependent oxidoreductase [Frankia sp. AiPs1]|uniref:SDR family NAD(P)-dependent oxidoreductase n=1 Tax=Frankia sp. AiPs1 TaxID=573493 RepID=UPI00204348B7|nr:SDR family NAD(P)-dependent oxidoreductase [Frankia sp. AiPs1]MCM3920235.1 SDR family NAD(P)-dependent oxidoreductase [Frankia sp. AiPs1]
MRTIAIVGAGPGLGRSIARRFGAEGFRVALVSRNQNKLDRLVDDLAADGIQAQGFAADVTDRAALAGALSAAKDRFGPIDVLEYSPAPPDAQTAGLAPVDAVNLTVESVAPQIEYYLYGAITAVRQVLPDMLARGEGAIFVSTGASSGPVIHPPFANIAAASGALRNWILNLHAALAPQGVYAAHVAIAAWIGQGGPKSQPDAIAETYWELHESRSDAERFYLDEEISL